ncbi:hypothetical protein CACET_c26100 [Clostridium aceticum]|uniref:Uncharacterized protein n=1 Tax=Clostridium aceticum TaxID=84022 RepID=A0A0D8I9T3_9CLOT|nr:hypothetical protein [Clostridium aceticum]AKL96055.1 hypothetical protein CACET_c26100 [Clostridium aceticum]KJF27018.1 hypothetical protein TZ02_09405 [Clostridium aceticum]
MEDKLSKCPNCHETTIGKISRTTYFCRNCYVEIVYKKGRICVCKHNEDGRMIDNIRFKKFVY